MLEHRFCIIRCITDALEITERSITHLSRRILLLLYVYFKAEFSELIRVDKSKDRPEGTSSSVELSKSFYLQTQSSACNNALVKSVCLKSLN